MFSQDFLDFRHVNVKFLTNPPFSAFQHQNGPGYQAATTSLTVEQQTALMEVMRKADEADRA